MPILAAASNDRSYCETIGARITEPVDEAERQNKYDNPISRALADEGIEPTVRGFSIPPDANQDLATVGIEVSVPMAETLAFIAQ